MAFLDLAFMQPAEDLFQPFERDFAPFIENLCPTVLVPELTPVLGAEEIQIVLERHVAETAPRIVRISGPVGALAVAGRAMEGRIVAHGSTQKSGD